MLSAAPLTRDLVLVGGGHAHALVLRQWGMNPLAGARLTVINPGPTAPYTGMLPGHVAGHYDRDTLEIDLMALARFAGARLILSHATAIDRHARLIHVEGRGPVAYDVASVDIGITARMGIDGFAEHAVGAKPLDVYAAKWRAFQQAVACGELPPVVAVIGGGVAGCELAMAMAHALRKAGADPHINVIEAGPHISGVGPKARAKISAAMAGLGVHLITHAQITQITASHVHLTDQPPVAAALCVGAAGAFPHDWIARTDLPLHNGFIVVDPDLRVQGDPNLFAVGDCAHMPFAPRPKAGVFAVRAAPVLHDNLRAVLTGGALRPFKPQNSYLKLVSLGGTTALAEKYGLAIAAPALWRWKDAIDHAFMRKLEQLPAMTPKAAPAQAALGATEDALGLPLCGGCGAKVGGTVLRDSLLAAPSAQHADVMSVQGDDAAILRLTGGGFQVLSTDHLRAFIEDPVQMTRIAAVHALGDIWAMGAAPQTALATVIVPRMSPALQRRTLAEINATAADVFAQAGAAVVGGHTTMGAELTIGFSVTGTRSEPPITLAGAQAGDLLVLTRPIGTGVILAAYMAGRAPPRILSQTFAQMEHPQTTAADVLRHAHAMTDVTGFGLAGHVQAICRASAVRAELWHNAIPLYEGARALSAQGIASSLFATNAADAPVEGVHEPLVHDPQTAGGLLAALPEAEAHEAIGALKSRGGTGWIIGRILKGTGLTRLITQ